MPFRFDRIRLLTVFMLAVWGFPVSTGSASEPVGDGSRVFIFLQSLEDPRGQNIINQNIIKQNYDYSCGAAALATLLTYGLGDHVTERDILLSALASLPKDEAAVREKEGLSLADLQQAAQERGHKAQGFRLAPVYLTSLKGPVIVFLKAQGYKHFAVLKGIRGDYAYLADPSVGNIRLPMHTFLAMWLDKKGQGILFVVERKDGTFMQDSPLQLPPE